jgi:aspartyl-tRNA(Asn)/glutamyl-tRNA(Gln) amidotransferase subunit A
MTNASHVPDMKPSPSAAATSEAAAEPRPLWRSESAHEIARRVGAGMAAPGAIPRLAIDAARREQWRGAFWYLDEAGAADTVAVLERRAESRGNLGPLAGVPVAVKDSIDVCGCPSTGGLRGRARVAAVDSEVVRRVRQAGGVPIGKTAMDPLGWSTRGRAPGYPECLSPVGRGLSPGGSSAGSAVAVATGLVPLALGTDLAGSVRIPASYCGVVGLKPPARGVPSRGCLGIARGFDVAGVLARSVDDCVLAFEAIARHAVPRPRRRLAVALLEDLMEESDAEVAGVCSDALARAGDSEVDVERMSLGWRPQGYGRVLAYELATTWGPRIGRFPQCFPDEVIESAERGRHVSEQRYQEALLDLRRAAQRLRRRLANYHAVAAPTVPTAVPGAGEDDLGASIRFTRIFSALGWCAISLPCGVDAAGRPVGLQIAGPADKLPGVVAVARAVERSCAYPGTTRWPFVRPKYYDSEKAHGGGAG